MASTSLAFDSVFRRQDREHEDVVRLRKNYERRASRLRKKLGPDLAGRLAERLKSQIEENEAMFVEYGEKIREKERLKRTRMDVAGDVGSSRKRMCLGLRDRAINRAKRICPWVLDYQSDLPVEVTYFRDDPPWTPMQATPLRGKSSLSCDLPHAMVLEEEILEGVEDLQITVENDITTHLIGHSDSQKGFSNTISFTPVEGVPERLVGQCPEASFGNETLVGSSKSQIGFTPREGVPERLVIECPRASFGNKTLGGSSKPEIGFTPREGVPERLHIDEPVNPTAETPVHAEIDCSDGISIQGSCMLEEQDFIQVLFEDYRGVKPVEQLDNTIPSPRGIQHKTPTEVVDSLGDVDCLLASDSTFDFNKTQGRSTGSSVGGNISSQVGNLRQLPECSMQNNSTGCSQIKGCKVAASDSTPATTMASSLGTDNRSSQGLERSCIEEQKKCPSFGSWGITVRSQHCLSESDEGTSHHSAQVDATEASTPPLAGWMPPRSPTPFNRNRTISHESDVEPQVCNTPDGQSDPPTAPLTTISAAFRTPDPHRPNSLPGTLMDVSSLDVRCRTNSPPATPLAVSPGGYSNDLSPQKSIAPVTSGSMNQLQSTSPLEEISNKTLGSSPTLCDRGAYPQAAISSGEMLGVQMADKPLAGDTGVSVDVMNAHSEETGNEPILADDGRESLDAAVEEQEFKRSMAVDRSTQVTPVESAAIKRRANKRKKENAPAKPIKPRVRTSLCGSSIGRVWVEEDGKNVRRSQRESHRPLRHWEGEKALYGRQFTSLTTVVGYQEWSPDPTKAMISLDHFRKNRGKNVGKVKDERKAS